MPGQDKVPIADTPLVYPFMSEGELQAPWHGEWELKGEPTSARNRAGLEAILSLSFVPMYLSLCGMATCVGAGWGT